MVWGHHLPPNTGIEARVQIMSRHYFTVIMKCMSCMLLCYCSVAQHVWLFWDSMDCGPPGSSVHGILQARIEEWVAFPPPGNLPDLGIEPTSPVLQVDSSPLSHWGRPWIFYRKWSSHHGQQKSLKCSTWMQSQKQQMISVRFQGKPFNITVIQAYAPTSNTKEAEVEWFY